MPEGTARSRRKCSFLSIEPNPNSFDLLAVERTGRRCRGVEIDPLYADVIIRRYEAETGREAVLEETRDTFGALAHGPERRGSDHGGAGRGLADQQAGI
jgi:hypothetical protein